MSFVWSSEFDFLAGDNSPFCCLFGNAFVGNHAPRRVLEKQGFVYEGTQRRCVCKRGLWLDQWMIAITRPDWESR
jgi:RimJ/RimL family protein N-acetyltransferase